jgi:hypothetical protein
MTTYDDIWETFLTICGYDSSELPQEDEKRYLLIKSGLRLYNQLADKYENRIQGNLEMNDTSETLNIELKDTEILIFVNLMASVFAYNKYTEFTSIWSTFTKETGIVAYRAQCQAREYTVQSFKDEATRLIEDEIDSFEV